MNTPPLLIAAALLFWAWQTGHWIIGMVAGAILESSRIIKFRWNLTQSDFNRLWNICSVLFLALAVVLLINENTISFSDFFVNAGRRPEAIREAGKSALVWFQWFPMIFFPFMLAQAFNERDRVGLATFSWWLRKQEARNPNANLPREEINVAFPYVAVCLLSASTVTERNNQFYFGIIALMAWCLFSVRSRRYAFAVWAAAFLVVAAAGYAGHRGLYLLQRKLEQLDVTWFSRFATAATDPKQAFTSIGSIGRLKMSDRIVLRVRTDGGVPPALLREASYNAYRAPVWSSVQRSFWDVLPEDEATWRLLPRKSTHAVNIAQFLNRGSGLLPLPKGSSEVSELQVPILQTNLFGATFARDGLGLVIYNVRYDDGAAIDSAPMADDQRSYDVSEPAVAQIADELQLRNGMDPHEAKKRVASFFAEKFSYSTYLGRDQRKTDNESALTRFLLHHRSGHCEYFATATTLLLRKAGLPTRYAVGYSVQEGTGKKYVVRERHAHAWTLVWHDNAWHDFDTTPGSWNAVEAAHASVFQPVKDFFSDLWFQFSKLRWSKTEWRQYFMWAPMPLLLLVIARFFFGKQWKKMRSQRKKQSHTAALPGIDSDFYLIEKHFASRGLPRRESESWSSWLRRIEEQEAVAAQLSRVVLLHQRLRFDPQGLSDAERAELRTEVSQWLAVRSS
jgi:transglutaminase-like putative cysteine protease